MINNLFLQIILPFFLSFVIQFIFIKTSAKKAFCIDCINNKPQRFHDVPISRAGGLGIFLSTAVSFWLLVISKESLFNPSFIADKLSLTIFYLILSSLPAFLAGFYEDLRSNIKPKLRLLVMSLGAVLAIVLMDAIVYDIGLLTLPLWIAIPFTLFAIVGVTNAINIIDGFNGLAGGVSIIVLSAFAMVSYIQDDQLILNICLILIFAILGFLVCNFPKGKIFLGDGGAYFIGFLLAIISILLVGRNPEISTWFPLVVLAYPIFEVLFSIYRKKFKRGGSAFEPDRVHFHMLIFKRISRNNPKTSVHIWILVAFFNSISLPFYSNTTILMIIFVIFSATYIYLYRSIVRFKTGGTEFETYLYEKKIVKNYLYRFLLLLIGHNWPKG